MDIARKKQLMAQYKERRPEMGVISLRCRETGESFLGASKDIKADFNSVCFKLTMGGHPNRRLQQLWTQYGQSGFECSVLKRLEYEDPGEDHWEELELLRELCFLDDPMAKKIWMALKRELNQVCF